MNASSNSLSGGSADSEITAELPVLDVAAYEARQGQDPLSSTDTWATSSLNTAILPQLATPPEAPSESQPAGPSGKLETDLKALAGNLAELRARLAAKGERLTVIEAELAQSREAGLAAATRAAALSDELVGSQSAVLAANAQIEGLQSRLHELDEAARLAADREKQARESLERGEAESASSRAADMARSAALVASHETALLQIRQQAGQLQAQNAAQLEVLQSLEGRRGVFDSILRSLDFDIEGRGREQARLADELARATSHGLDLTRELDQRAARISQLETEVTALHSRLGSHTAEAGAISRTNEALNQQLEGLREESAARAARVTDLEAQLATGAQAHAEALRVAAAAHAQLSAAHTALGAQKAALDAELDALREESAEHVAAVQQVTAEHANRMTQLEARDAQIATLTAQVETQLRSLQGETERQRVAADRIEVAENDLRASQVSIEGLEAELRSRNMRVEELTRINTQMQADMAEARLWLDERDSLLQRLESEAAHSAALVDNIQRSIRTGATGTHEVTREAGTRLLVQSQDGHEVVHVLGRKTTIGRTPDNDLQIDASFVSRHHAVLLVNGGQTVIEDLNSTNGVHINGQRVTRDILKDGDQVMIGRARFRFVVRPVGGRNAEPAA